VSKRHLSAELVLRQAEATILRIYGKEEWVIPHQMRDRL